MNRLIREPVVVLFCLAWTLVGCRHSQGPRSSTPDGSIAVPVMGPDDKTLPVIPEMDSQTRAGVGRVLCQKEQSEDEWCRMWQEFQRGTPPSLGAAMTVGVGPVFLMERGASGHWRSGAREDYILLLRGQSDADGPRLGMRLITTENEDEIQQGRAYLASLRSGQPDRQNALHKHIDSILPGLRLAPGRSTDVGLTFPIDAGVAEVRQAGGKLYLLIMRTGTSSYEFDPHTMIFFSGLSAR